MTGEIEDTGSIIDRIEDCYGGDSLWPLAIELFTGWGFPRIAYHHFPPLGAPDSGKVIVVAHGYPVHWIEDYIQRKAFLSDPIPAVAMNRTEPFLWSDVRKLIDLSKDQAEILDWREEHGLIHGLAMPVFGPNQRNGYFGFGFPDESFRLDRTALRQLQWIGHMLHHRYCTVVATHQPKVPKLSSRELEILEWMARGKSNSVIADIMGLSTHTVDAYIRRIFLKLGATDRITATVKGIGAGLVRGATPKKPDSPELKSA